MGGQGVEREESLVWQASSATYDPYSAALSLRPGTRRSVLTERRPSALHSLQLSMDVRWPLSIVITQVCILCLAYAL